MTPAARREAIVDAALRVANRRGFGSTTVRDVAAELGCSSGLIHHYFASMDDVLAAAFEQVAGRDLQVTEAAVAGADGPIEQLLAFFASYARTDGDWSFQLWLDAWAEASRRPALGATSRRLNVAWQRLMAEIAPASSSSAAASSAPRSPTTSRTSAGPTWCSSSATSSPRAPPGTPPG
jgi:AcrR family transcriptional regulator